MIYNSQGIVIRNIKYSESSLIVRIFTREHGMLAFLVPGVFSKKSSHKAALLQPMNVLNLTYYYRENRNLNKIKEFSLDNHFLNLNDNLAINAVLVTMSEIIYKSVKEQEKNTSLFDFLKNAISVLYSRQGPYSTFIPFFMLELSRFLGFYPTNNYSEEKPFFHLSNGYFVKDFESSSNCLNAYHSRLFGIVIAHDWKFFDEWKIAFKDWSNLMHSMEKYYQFHLDGFTHLNSLEIFQKVFQ